MFETCYPIVQASYQTQRSWTATCRQVACYLRWQFGTTTVSWLHRNTRRCRQHFTGNGCNARAMKHNKLLPTQRGIFGLAASQGRTSQLYKPLCSNEKAINKERSTGRYAQTKKQSTEPVSAAAAATQATCLGRPQALGRRVAPCLLAARLIRAPCG